MSATTQTQKSKNKNCADDFDSQIHEKRGLQTPHSVFKVTPCRELKNHSLMFKTTSFVFPVCQDTSKFITVNYRLWNKKEFCKAQVSGTNRLVGAVKRISIKRTQKPQDSVALKHLSKHPRGFNLHRYFLRCNVQCSFAWSQFWPDCVLILKIFLDM